MGAILLQNVGGQLGVNPIQSSGRCRSDVSYIQVCTFHDGCKQGIDQQVFNRKSISCKITHPQSWKLQAKLTCEKL